MDLELLTGILGAIPETGAYGVLLGIIFMLLRWQGQTATQHQAELTQLREENTRLRKQRDESDTRLRERLGLVEPEPPGERTGPIRRRLGR